MVYLLAWFCMIQKNQHTFLVTASLDEVQKVMRMHGVTEVSELFQRLLTFEEQRTRFLPRPKEKTMGIVK